MAFHNFAGVLGSPPEQRPSGAEALWLSRSFRLNSLRKKSFEMGEPSLRGSSRNDLRLVTAQLKLCPFKEWSFFASCERGV